MRAHSSTHCTRAPTQFHTLSLALSSLMLGPMLSLISSRCARGPGGSDVEVRRDHAVYSWSHRPQSAAPATQVVTWKRESPSRILSSTIPGFRTLVRRKMTTQPLFIALSMCIDPTAHAPSKHPERPPLVGLLTWVNYVYD